MEQFRNTAAHPEDLAGGRIVGAYETFELSDDELRQPYNQRKIESGSLLSVDGKDFDFSSEKYQLREEPEPQQQEAEPIPVSREELLKKAKKLKVENADELDDTQLAEAVAAAEESKGA